MIDSSSLSAAHSRKGEEDKTCLHLCDFVLSQPQLLQRLEIIQSLNFLLQSARLLSASFLPKQTNPNPIRP